MTEAFSSVGGAKFYVPQEQANNKEFFKVLPKEGDNNVVQYNGITMKFPEQQDIKIEKDSRPAHVCMFNGSTEIMLKDATIFGSPKDDRVRSYCISSVFNFKGGGDDEILHYKYNDGNYTEPEKNSRFLIDGKDKVVEHHKIYDEDNNKKPVGEFIITRTNNGADGNYEFYDD